MARTIVAVVDDMFFASKIRATAEALGVTVRFPRSIQSLLAIVKEQAPALVLFDLHNHSLNPIDVVRQIKSNDELNEVRVLGFFSHVQRDLQQKALEAGFNKVIPRSVFSRDLGRILSEEM